MIPIPVEIDAMLAILNLPKEMSNNGIRDATRLAIQMLSDMPRAEKINQNAIDKLMGIINTQLGDRSLPWSMSPPRR
mgnify:CR=1 FL=1